jgi:adenine C2-methylase RlmN of 23S rRNA A2503 and tRNA A37
MTFDISNIKFTMIQNIVKLLDLIKCVLSGLPYFQLKDQIFSEPEWKQNKRTLKLLKFHFNFELINDT